LLIVAVGGFWFIPATHINALVHAGSVSPAMAFVAFLAGVWAIASGLTFLETIANPYTTVLGERRYAATRINIAQSCNGVGWIFGPIIGGVFFYSRDAAGHSTGSQTLYIPYVTVAGVVLVLAVIFFFARIPDIKTGDEYHLDDSSPQVSHSIWSHPHFVFAVAAQFFYVAAQAGIFSFFINYMTSEVPAIPSSWNAGMTTLAAHSGWLHDWLRGWFETNKAGVLAISDKGASNLASLGFVCFLVGRFTGAGLLRKFAAHKILGLYALLNVAATLLVFQAGMGVRGLRFPQLFLHVDHVPDDFCAGDFRPRRAGEESLGVHRDGDHGRRHPAETDGLRGRQVRYVARLHRAHVLLRPGRAVRFQLAQVQQGGVAGGHAGAERSLGSARGADRQSARRLFNRRWAGHARPLRAACFVCDIVGGGICGR